MNIHTIDATTDRSFLREKRKDPVTQQLLKSGDRVIVCANDKMVFLESVWSGSCPLCGGTNTLDHLPVRSSINASINSSSHSNTTNNNTPFVIRRTNQVQTTENTGCLGSMVYIVATIIALLYLVYLLN